MTRPLDVHLDDDTLRLLAIEPAAGDAAATGHLAACAACQTRAVGAQRELEALRAEATAATDAAFSPADLARQQRAIAARLSRGHRVARVLRFPIHGIPASPPADRRWLAAAAAAGLVVGVLAGQLPHLGGSPQIVGPPSARAVAPAARPDGLLEDTLLSEVEAALDPDPSPELRALDALTPVHYEIR
jgi:hypothetical protein